MTHLTTTDDSPAPSSDGARRKRLARVIAQFVSCAALLCSGCTIYIGPYDDSGGTAPEKPSVLPDPIEGPADEPALDEAQQARKEEAERYTAEVIYKGGEILATFQLPSGDLLDFINRGTLPALPYVVPPLPFSPADLALPPGVDPLEKAIMDDCPDRAWSKNVPKRHCTKDSECGDGFCDRGRCAALWTCGHNYGQRCESDGLCDSGPCIDGRCSSCASDAECVRLWRDGDAKCQRDTEVAGARRCIGNIPSIMPQAVPALTSDASDAGP